MSRFFRRRISLSFALVGAALTIGLLWWSDLPLGVPGQWTWNRIPYADLSVLDVLMSGLLVSVAAAVYVGLAWYGSRRVSHASRWETAGWLGGLVLGGFAWLWTVQETPPEAYRLSKIAWVLYYPGASGYFFEAQYKIDDTAGFLAGYEEKMAEGDVLHVGTHPPGLFLAYRGLIALCEQSPRFTQMLLATQPESVRDALEIIEHNTRFSSTPLGETGKAVLWLAALLTQAFAALAVVPLFLLLRRDFSRRTSWSAAAFWPLVPAVAVFLPKSDALFPFLGLLFLYLWLEGRTRQSPLWCAAAGLSLWTALLLTLAFLPVAVAAVLLTAWETETAAGADRRRAWRATGRAVAWGGGAFLAACLVLWLIYGVNLAAVWKLNLQNHAGFYDVYPRTYWKWLLVNPLELALGVGLPVLILAASSYAGIAKSNTAQRKTTQSDAGLSNTSPSNTGSSKTGPSKTDWRDRRLGPYLVCPLVWGLLWISGKNMGEAARLWIFLMPWAVWLSAWALESPAATGGEAQPRPQRTWLAFLIVQAAVCIATVTRVNGFDFADYIGS